MLLFADDGTEIDQTSDIRQHSGRSSNLFNRSFIVLTIAEDPTAGVDVGAKAVIYHMLYQALASEMGVLVVSTDFEEIAAICHRAIVFSRGLPVTELAGVELSTESLIEAASANEAA